MPKCYYEEKNLKWVVNRYNKGVKKAINDSEKSYGTKKKVRKDEDNTLDVLKMLYAKGKITIKQFE